MRGVESIAVKPFEESVCDATAIAAIYFHDDALDSAAALPKVRPISVAVKSNIF